MIGGRALKRGVIAGFLVVVGFLVMGPVMALFGGYEKSSSSRTEAAENTVLGVGAQMLAARLEEAFRLHGYCYGWEIDPGDGRPREAGSNLGAGLDVREAPKECPKWVLLKVEYTHHEDYFEEKEWSTVEYFVLSGDPVLHGAFGLSPLGILSARVPEEGGLAELANAIGVLPQLVAERKGLPPVPAWQWGGPSTVYEPLSVWGGGRVFAVGSGAVLIAGGLLWAVLGVRRARDEF